MTAFPICGSAGRFASRGAVPNLRLGCAVAYMRNQYEKTSRYASVRFVMKKNPHAVALGKLAAKARWKGVPKAERVALARKAGKARWAGLTKAERSTLAGRGGAASRGQPKK